MVTANENASRRTRNRIREHSLKPTDAPIRKIGVIPGSSPGWDGKHFTCTKCLWIGWLPIKEIEWEDVDAET